MASVATVAPMSTSKISKGGPESNRRRSQRVILSLAVLVRTEGAPRESSFEEETRTLVVNAHGALIALAGKVDKGQTLRLTNRATNIEQLCKVSYLGSSSDGKTQIGVEFVTPSPEFWQIAFPPENWTTPQPEPASQKK
jgi:hypothetical protein